MILIFVIIALCACIPYTADGRICECNTSNGKGNNPLGCLGPDNNKNAVCKNGFGDWGTCIPNSGCPIGNNGGPARKKSAIDNGNFTRTFFMEPVPQWSYVYECQNSSLFLAVYNISHQGLNHKGEAVNIYFNTLTCLTAVPAQQSGGFYFDVATYNSCDEAGACGQCGDCNCSCRVDNPWWWNCCYDPCFGCPHCCGCTRNNWSYNWFDGGSCLQCNNDGWCGEPNGQMLTPTVCQIALQINAPGNNLDYEELASSNFSYNVRILHRTIGCESCQSEAMANLTVYVKDCNEWPIFQNRGASTRIYQYDGLNDYFYGPALYIQCNDPDVFNIQYNSVMLNIQGVTLNNVAVNPMAWYIENTNFVGSNMQANANNSILKFDVDRCGSSKTFCLDLFRYAFVATPPPLFRIVVTATDGGGLISTATYTVTILDSPSTPQWVNLPATVSIIEFTPGTGTPQIYPVTAIVPGFVNNANHMLRFGIVNVDPMVDFTGRKYFDLVSTCSPAVPSAVQCNGLVLTTNVTATTFDYLKQKTYNLTIWLTYNVTGNPNVLTISSSVIVNILQLIYQPVLIPNNTAYFLKENVTGAFCFYDIKGYTHKNNHTYFIYTMLPISAAPSSIFLNGSQVCYDDARGTAGPTSAPHWIFNADNTPIFNLRILVDDPYSVRPPPTFSLTLNIVDVEDPPILNTPVYQNVPETSTAWPFTINCTKEANQPVVKFRLVNQDSPSNNTMWYITAQNGTVADTAGYARIDANRFIVPNPMFNSTRVPIIYLDVQCYTNQYTVENQIVFFIQRTNTAPTFTNLPNSTFIAEAVSGIVQFFTVSTVDRENDPRRIFFGTGTNPCTSLATRSSFAINNTLYMDPVTGIIQTNIIPGGGPSFNYTSLQAAYNLTICTLDLPPAGFPARTSTSTFWLYIVLNNTAPAWISPPPGSNNPTARCNPNITETATGQRYLFNLSAVDREGDKIYYKIIDVLPTNNSAFRVAWGSSQLEYNQDFALTKPMFNFRAHPVYFIVMEALDQRTTPTSTTTVTCYVDYVPLPAKFTNLPAYLTVREDVYWGPVDLLTVGAIDPNNMFPVTITRIQVRPDTTQTYFHSTNNTLGYNFNPGFAYGVNRTYTMIFTAFNTVNPPATSSVILEILPVPQGPKINSTGIVYIYENVTTGQTLWDMRAKDNFTNFLNYAILDVNPSGFNKFTVSSNGIIRSVDRPNFNYQTAPYYIVRATATNSQNMAVTFTLTVSIIDTANQPVITNLPAFVSIKEGSVGSVLGGLYSTRCVDPDNRALSWNYNVLPNTGYSYFNVSTSGVVQITQYSAFNYLEQPYYYVVVFCSNGAYTATGTLTVVVLWTTSTTSTTPSPRTTVPDDTTTTTVIPPGDLLTPEQIGAISGSLLGALVLAAASWGIARYLQRKARKEGLTATMKKPHRQFMSTKI